MKKYIKKLVGITLLAMVAFPLSAFAEKEIVPGIKMGGWGRALFVPGMGNDRDETIPRDDPSWGGSPRIGFNIRGESEKIGFYADVNVDGGGIGTHDQQKIWAKPFENVTVEVGPSIFYDALRGNSAFGAWNWLRYDKVSGEDNIFTRGRAGKAESWEEFKAGESPVGGALIHLDTPDGFYVFAALDILEDDTPIGTTVDEDGAEVIIAEQYTTGLMLQRGQYGIGYNVKGFGMIRAQYNGRAYKKATDEGEIPDNELESYSLTNVAVKVDQAIENLYLDIGAFIPSDSDSPDDTKYVAYANYKMDKITGHLLTQAVSDQVIPADDDNKEEEGTGISFAIGVDYDIGDGYGLNSDLRFYNNFITKNRDLDQQYAYMVGITKFLGNGIIGIAYESTNGQFGWQNLGKEEVDDAAWAIPIKLEYWF